MKQSEVALVTKSRVLGECWEIMATAAQVTGHCVCRWARSSMPLPQSTQARLDERHSAIPPREKLRVPAGWEGVVRVQACVVPELGGEARWEGAEVVVDAGGGVLGEVVADPTRVQLLHQRVPGSFVMLAE